MRAIQSITRPVCAGIDVGNGRVKVVTNVGHSFFFQSIAAPARLLGEAVSGVDDLKPVMIGDEPWIAGLPAKTTRGVAQAIHKGAHFSDQHHALFLEAVGRVGLNIDVCIVGMTVDQIGLSSDLQAKLLGEHSAHGMQINVGRVGVYPQPRGTAKVYLETVDELIDQTILIVDIGEGSTDVNLLTVALGEDDRVMVTVDRTAAFSDWAGVASVSEKVAASIGVQPTQISAALGNKQVAIKGVEIAPLVDEAAGELSDILAAEIKTKVRSFDDIDTILLTGGGAHVFGRHLRDRFDRTCEVMKDASMANARGFLMMAEDAAAL